MRKQCNAVVFAGATPEPAIAVLSSPFKSDHFLDSAICFLLVSWQTLYYYRHDRATQWYLKSDALERNATLTP